MDRHARRYLLRHAIRGGALALAASCANCSSIGDPYGYAIVTQDKYDFMSCKEILGNRSGEVNRIKQLEGLVAKANASPGGFLVSANAYGSDLEQTRAKVRAADRAIALNKCEPPKP